MEEEAKVEAGNEVTSPSVASTIKYIKSVDKLRKET